jgi:cysteine synthase A
MACSNIHDTILDTIGRTPVIRINNLGPKNVKMFVKVEAFNPMSSVKDRLALAIIEDAERKGAIKPGQTVVEATSGNTGIALAMVCAVKGYPFVAVMADSFSVERRKLMKGLGAKVVLTPAAQRGTGMVNKARELAAQHGWFEPLQFSNLSNPEYHANTTGPEILSDFRGHRLDYFVSGWGTGGTIVGATRVIKAARPDCKIVCAEPAVAAALSGEQWNPHPIQGWTPDFVPELLQGFKPDQFVKVDGKVACATARLLATKEGIFCGISSGATFAAALEVAQTAPEGSHILAMLPDTGERYFSSVLFNDIPEGSDEV